MKNATIEMIEIEINGDFESYPYTVIYDDDDLDFASTIHISNDAGNDEN